MGQGKGAFGSVVKARNKIDSLIYAVKKIKLRATQSDSKIFREVNALSRLNHRFIVRYYTTWVETAELASTTASSANSDSGTSVPDSRDGTMSGHSADLLTFNMDDLHSNESHHSFPSIRFTRSGTPESSSSSQESDEVYDDPFLNEGLPQKRPSSVLSVPPISRTLYIQMVGGLNISYHVVLVKQTTGICRTSNIERGRLQLLMKCLNVLTCDNRGLQKVYLRMRPGVYSNRSWMRLCTCLVLVL